MSIVIVGRLKRCGFVSERYLRNWFFVEALKGLLAFGENRLLVLLERILSRHSPDKRVDEVDDLLEHAPLGGAALD